MSASSVGSLLAALAIIITAARLLGALARRVGQPAVVGEILAGIILGPTFFGAGLANHLFPAPVVRTALGGIGNLGLALFMFIVGYELDHKLVRSGGRASVTISLASIAVPLGLGVALGLWLASQQHVGHSVSFALFIGVATAITAFPVLARILTDRGMQRTRIGSLALASAAIDDICAWTLLAVVLLIARSSNPGSWRILLLPAYILIMAVAVRPALRRLSDLRDRAGRLTPDILAVIMVGLLASAYATELMGLNFIFGAFLFGALMPREGAEALRLEILTRLEQLAVLVLLPVYFVLAGLNVDLSGFGARSAVDLILILAVAIVGKFGGAYFAGRFQHVASRPAAALATLMNTRGLTEIVILTVGLQLHILNVQLYSLMVVMALVTTAMTGPLLNVVYPPRLVQRDIAEADRALLGEVAAYRVLVATGDPATDDELLALGAALTSGREAARLIIAALLPYPRAPLELGTGLHTELAEMAQSMTDMDAAVAPLRARGIEVSALTRFAADPAAELADLAATSADVVVISRGHPGYEAVTALTAVRLVTAAAPLPPVWSEIFVRAGNGTDALAAVEVAAQLAAGQPARLGLSLSGQAGRHFSRLVAQLTAAGLAAEVTGEAADGALIVAGHHSPAADTHVLVRAEADYESAEPTVLSVSKQRQEVG